MEFLDKGSRRGLTAIAPPQTSTAQATAKPCCLRPGWQGCWGGTAPGMAAEAALLSWSYWYLFPKKCITGTGYAGTHGDELWWLNQVCKFVFRALKTFDFSRWSSGKVLFKKSLEHKIAERGTIREGIWNTFKVTHFDRLGWNNLKFRFSLC